MNWQDALVNNPRMRVCGVCGRVLAFDEQFGYRHELQDLPEDHPPVAVLPTDAPVRARCDFCNADEATYTLPVCSFAMAPTYMSQGDWAVCSGCAPLIERNDWNGVMRRYRENGALGRALPLALEQRLRRLWRDVRKNIKGPMTPNE